MTLLVGERLQLRAMAAWAIPSMTEETEKAAWTVSDPAVGDVDKDGVFTARKAGRAVVTAVIRVSEDGAGEVLGPGQTAASGPVKTFSDELELNVREATLPRRRRAHRSKRIPIAAAGLLESATFANGNRRSEIN